MTQFHVAVHRRYERGVDDHDVYMWGERYVEVDGVLRLQRPRFVLVAYPDNPRHVMADPTIQCREGELEPLLRAFVKAGAAQGFVPDTPQWIVEQQRKHLDDMRRIVFHQLGIKDEEARDDRRR